MSHALNLAVSLPLLVGLPAVIVVLGLVGFVLMQQNKKKRTAAAWIGAAEELGIDLNPEGSSLGASAGGRVNEHAVTVAPVTGKGRQKSTQYNVKFEATEAPPFRLIKRDGHELPVLDTGNPKFDAVVVVQTHDQEGFTKFLTSARRAAILRTLDYWPEALISNSDIHLTMPGIEDKRDHIVDAVCQLVATAETFDKPHTPPTLPTRRARETETAEAAPTDVSPTEAPPTEAPSGVLTELRLDEMTVLNDLFNTGLNSAQIEDRFESIYKGHNVRWSGEVVRVGALDAHGRQPIAALVGSADGQTTQSGRVVALSTVGAEPVRTAGDVVEFSGSLVNLDTAQRMFHIY